MKHFVMRISAFLACGGLALVGCSSDGDGNAVVGDPNSGLSPDPAAVGGPGPGAPAAGSATFMDGMAQGMIPVTTPIASPDPTAVLQPPVDGVAMPPGTAAPTSGAGEPVPMAQADAGTAAADGVLEPSPAAQGTCLQGAGDFSEDGPYEVNTERVTIGSSGEFTIFVPDPLEESCPHPVVAWGNGTIVSGGTAYTHFNRRIASWGIIAIASHDDGTANSGPRIGDGSFHQAAIDYMLAENENPDSQFFGKVSDRAGVSGHSQGGAGGDRASSHPNVKANGNVQGSFGMAPPDVAFLCLTGTEDIATEGCETAVNGTSSPAFYANFDGMGHIETVTTPRAEGNQQYARLLSGWFRCFLADDTAACEMFQGGENCPLCQERGWAKIFAKNM